MANSRNGNPLSVTFQGTSAVFGLFSATTSGVAIGSTGGTKASSHAVNSDRISQRDSLLATIQQLSNELGKINAPDNLNFNLLPLLDDSSKKTLQSTAEEIVLSVATATAFPTSAATHISQLPLDLTAAIKGLRVSLENQQGLIFSAASTLDQQRDAEAFSFHCKLLTQEIHNISAKTTNKINDEIKDRHFTGASHNHAAISSAVTLGAVPLTIAAVISASLDSIVSTLRESSGVTQFLKNESLLSREEKNVYHALSEATKSKNSAESLAALKKLEEALSNFNPAHDMSVAHSVTSPFSAVILRQLTSSPFTTALRAITSSSIAGKLVTQLVSKEKDDPASIMSTATAARASTILLNADHHFANLSTLTKRFQKLLGKIDVELENFPDKNRISASAQSTAVLSGLVSAIPLLMTDLVGVFSREMSGAIHSLIKDQGTHEQSTHVLKTDKANTGANLDALLKQASQMQERLGKCQALGVTAPVTLGATHALSSGGLTATLNSMAGIYSVIKELQTLSMEPSKPTQLDAKEVEDAKQDKNSLIKSNQNSAQSTGSASVSDEVSLHNKLQSIMEKVVLTHRSGKNFLDAKQPGNERADINSSAKSTLAFSQGNSTGFLSGALGILALVSLQSGISVETFFRGLRIAIEKSVGAASVGPDMSNIAGFKFNLSSASNTTRLAAELKTSALQTTLSATYHTAELISLRSLTVALCQSGIFREALSDLSAQNKRDEGQAEDRLGFMDNDLLNKLADNIVVALNKAAEPNGFVNGLNQDMASQLSSATKSSIATALSTHSVFILPCLQSIAAARAASKNSKEHQKQDVIASSSVAQTISTGSNILQNFTLNCIEQLKKQAVSTAEEKELHPLNQTHESSKTVNASTMVATCCLSLLCDELLELSLVSRSVTLLQHNEVSDGLVKSNEVAVKTEQESVAEITADSQLGDVRSTTQIPSALRLTLSHIGNSLKNFASELQKECEKIKMLEEKGDLHSGQRSLMQSLGSSLSQCASGVTAVVGMLSMMPASSAGVIDDIRRCIHHLDAHLQIDPLGSGSAVASTVASESESYVLTGITTDSAVNLLVTVTKLLLQSVLLGAEGTLSIAKVLEILSLHPRPDQALTLETAGLSQPNDLTQNVRSLVTRVLVSTNVTTATASQEMKVPSLDSTDRFIENRQKEVDERIDQLKMLNDSEEGNSLGLKEFYQTIIEVLVEKDPELREIKPDEKKIYIDNLIARFDQGGITLSSCHSTYDGIPKPAQLKKEKTKNENPLLSKNKFLNCDDASELMQSFIDTAARTNNVLLDTLHLALQNRLKHLSPSANTHWNFLLDSIESKKIAKGMQNRVLHPKQAMQKFDKNKYRFDLANRPCLR